MRSKKLSLVTLLVILAMIAACLYVAAVGFGKDHIGTAKNIKLGLDLAGGVNITYQANDENPSAEDMSDTVYKLQQRVTAYSTEAEVYQQGTNRINVDIPGVYDAEEILATLGNPGTISFCEGASDEAKGEEVLDGYFEVLNGNNITSASVTTQPDDYGNSEYVVSLMFDNDGTTAFAEATKRNVGKPIYIIYDGKVISSPRVNQTISNGQCVIEGNFTYESANALATTIRAGKLKLGLTEISSKVVSAKLGSEAVAKSLKAGIIGLIIVMIFMIVLYWIPGLAAAIALALYVSALMCFLNGLDITLTLPGMAGIILTIGMAVDANVIIFTRIREEIAAGQRVNEAIRIGFNKALSAVIDGNVTTLIAAAILYLKGTGTIQGFAITLALGIILSMFTALVITRLVLLALYGLGFNDEKYFGKQKAPVRRGFYGMRKITYVIAVIAICIGFVSMGLHSSSGDKVLNYSLDFTGGTAMTVTFKDNLEIPGADEEKLEKLVAEYGGTTDVQFQKNTGTTEVVIKTPILDPEHRGAVKDALVEQYGIDEAADITEENISGTISSEMRSDAIVSVIVAAIFILIYIWIRFRDLRFGASAVIALVHDILVTLAVYAVLRIPVGTTFIACMLTIVGYSINATIVIFDRVRENIKAMPTSTNEDIVNLSIAQTLSRSINTSLTTLIMVVMLYILGVTSIREFALPMAAGIIAGTFSSVFLSATLWCMMRGSQMRRAKPSKAQLAAEAALAGNVPEVKNASEAAAPVRESGAETAEKVMNNASGKDLPDAVSKVVKPSRKKRKRRQ